MIMTQADMFDTTTVTGPTFANYYAFKPIIKALVTEAAAFRGPVYLVNGDSHVYNVDRPLAAGSKLAQALRGAGHGQEPDPNHRRRGNRCRQLPEVRRAAPGRRGADLGTGAVRLLTGMLYLDLTPL